MRPIRAAVYGCVTLLGTAALSPAAAGWQSVFQVTCFHHSGPVISRYAPDPCCDPCPQPCPQPVTTTRYVQRCFYQPEVTYQSRTYYEPVTTYRRSFYYEPVTCWRYSCYYDPCTCSYQRVATPQTSYKLRSQCCPVQSWVQRCCSVPVTTYRKCCYWEAQTCVVDPCAPHAAVPHAAAPYNGSGAMIQPGAAIQPGVVQTPGVAPGVIQNPVTGPAPAVQPGVQEFRGNGGTGSPLYDQRYGPSQPMSPALPEGSGSSWQHRSQRLPNNGPPPIVPPVAKPQAPVAPRLNGIAQADQWGPVRLAGRIVVDGIQETPRAGAR